MNELTPTKTIGVTGPQGLIAWHLRSFYQPLKADYRLRLADRETFVDPARLDEFVRDCDVIVHLAGVNRGSDAEVTEGNHELARQLLASLDRTAQSPDIIFASSTHIDRGSAYGRVKKQIGEELLQWADTRGVNCTVLVMPHVFGEFGRPFYNSAVSTFCHQLAHGETPEIIYDGDLELIHAQDVAGEIHALTQTSIHGVHRLQGRRMRVSEMLNLLQRIDKQYKSGVLPDLEDSIVLQLFNTYRSYLYPSYYPRSLVLHADARGWLFESVKTRHGGQCFLSSTSPGITRGNHFHFSKVERFLVVSGKALIRVRKLLTDQVDEFHVSGDKPQFIDIPTLHTHSIENTGDTELLTLFWAHEIFDPESPDTYPEEVITAP